MLAIYATISLMTPVLKLFWNICILRDGPERIPTHGYFIALLVAADLGLATFIYTHFVGYTAVTAMSYVIVALAVSAAITWFALYVKNVDGRFPATFAALIGCDVVIGTLLAVALQITAPFENVVQSAAAMGFQIWSIVVAGFILKRALGSTLTIGILIALGTAFLGAIISNVAVAPTL